MVTHTYNTNWETEAGGSPQLEGYPGLHDELKDSLNYKARPFQKQTNK